MQRCHTCTCGGPGRCLSLHHKIGNCRLRMDQWIRRMASVYLLDRQLLWHSQDLHELTSRQTHANAYTSEGGKRCRLVTFASCSSAPSNSGAIHRAEPATADSVGFGVAIPTVSPRLASPKSVRHAFPLLSTRTLFCLHFALDYKIDVR